MFTQTMHPGYMHPVYEIPTTYESYLQNISYERPMSPMQNAQRPTSPVKFWRKKQHDIVHSSRSEYTARDGLKPGRFLSDPECNQKSWRKSCDDSEINTANIVTSCDASRPPVPQRASGEASNQECNQIAGAIRRSRIKAVEEIYAWIFANIRTEKDLQKIINTIKTTKKYSYMTCISYYIHDGVQDTRIHQELVDCKFLVTKSKTSLSHEQHIDKLWECFSIHSTIRSIRKWDIVMILQPGDLMLNSVKEFKGNTTFISQYGCCYTRKDYEHHFCDDLIQMIEDFNTNTQTRYEFYGEHSLSGSCLRISALHEYYTACLRYNTILFKNFLKNDEFIGPNVFHFV